MLEGQKFTPLNDRLLVSLLPVQTMIGLLHLPEKAQELSRWACVLAVGAEVKNNFKVLDDVLVADHAGTRIVVGRESYLVIKERDILALRTQEQAA